MKMRLLLILVGAALVLGAFHYAPTAAQDANGYGFFTVDVNWVVDANTPNNTSGSWAAAYVIEENPLLGQAALVGAVVDRQLGGNTPFGNGNPAIVHDNDTDLFEGSNGQKRIAGTVSTFMGLNNQGANGVTCFVEGSSGNTAEICASMGIVYDFHLQSSTRSANNLGNKFWNGTYTDNEYTSRRDSSSFRYLQPWVLRPSSDWGITGTYTVKQLIFFGEEPIEEWYTPFTEADEHHLWANELITDTALYHPPPLEGWGDKTVHSTSETEDALVHAAVSGQVVKIQPLDVDDCPPEGYQGTTCDLTILDADGTPYNDSIVAVADWSAGAVITIDPDTDSYPDGTQLQYIVKNPYQYVDNGTQIEAGCVLGEALRVQYDRIANKPIYRYYTSAQLIEPSPAEGESGRYDLQQHLTKRPESSEPCSGEDDACFNANPYLTNLDDWQLNTGGNLFSGYSATERAVSLEPGASITQLIDGLEANYYYSLTVFAVGSGTLDVSLLDGVGTLRFESDNTPTYKSVQLSSSQSGVMHPLRIEANSDNEDSLIVYYVCLAPGELDLLGSACYFVNPSFTDGGYGWDFGGDIGFNNSIAEFGPSAYIGQQTVLNTADDGSAFEYSIDLYFGEHVNYSNIAGADGDLVLSMTYNEVRDEIARIDIPQVEFEDLGTDRAKRTISYTVDRYSGGNLLQNGNFESADISMWTDNNSNATYSVSNGELVANRASGSNEVQIQQELSLENWSVGEQLEITADIRKSGSAAKTAGFRVIGYEEPNTVQQNIQCEFSITDSAERYTLIRTAIADWDGGRFRLTIDDTDQTTDVIFDNVTVRSVGNAGVADGCYSPGTAPTAAANANRLFTLESDYSLTDAAVETYIAIDRVCITPITANTFPGYDNSVIEGIGDGGLDDDGNATQCKASIQKPNSTILNPQLWAWFLWLWDNLFNSFNCIFVPAFEIMIDFLNEMFGVLISFSRYIATLNTLWLAFLFSGLRYIAGFLLNLFLHPAIKTLLEFLTPDGEGYISGFLDMLSRGWRILRNFGETIVDLIRLIVTNWGDVVTSWRNAPPIPTPGMPDCVANPDAALCLGVWVMDNTIFGDTRLYLAISILIITYSLLVLLWTIRSTRRAIEKMQSA